MRNILLIGRNIKTVGNDIWKKNTNVYHVSTSTLTDRNFIDFILSAKTSILCSMEEKYLDDITVNGLMDFCDRYKFLPMFVVLDKSDLAHSAFLTLNDRYRDSLEYTINDEEKEYKDFVNICSEYLIGCDEDDTIISTSDRG